MLNICETPAELRQSPTPYPRHSIGPNIEQAFYEHAMKVQGDVNSSWTYLPIFWQNNYFRDRVAKGTHDYGAVPEVEAFLKTLDPDTQYFTVSQADEGVYECLPPNVMVFSAGGTGDIAIPLICDEHPMPTEPPARDLLASFLGNINTGGPVELLVGRKPHRSSWDPNGRGATVRRAMLTAFNGQPGCYISNGSANSQQAIDDFRVLSLRSRFSLCPRGYGRTSFRLYETLQMGSIPVYIYDTPWLPYCEQLDWSTFCVLCHVNDVYDLPARLQGISDKDQITMREAGQKARQQYFTMAATCRHILQYVSEASR